jgi:glycine betaine/proline transport system substrate-binding protein
MLDPFRRLCAVLFMIAVLFSFPAEASAARPIKIASVGWTGVTVKTDLAVSILKSLGYEAENFLVSVPIAYKAMESGDADAFMGNWLPSQNSICNPYFKNGSVIKYVKNMSGAKYTLAVPTYCAQAGLKDFKDIARFAKKLDWKIYGIEAGNDGNEIVQHMIDKNKFNLGKFTVVPSSEAGMLAQVQSYVRDKKWIVFLGWAPHSMNEKIDMTYLTGSTAETFGSNDGTASVWTNIRKGFDSEYPNAARLLKQMIFTVPMMNQIMLMIKNDDSLTTVKAGLLWLRKHPDMYKKWLEGVKTVSGEPGLPAFEKVLESN